MKVALAQANKAFALGEVPVGAVITESTSGSIIATTHNRVEQMQDPTAHAEILAIRKATAILGTKLLSSCSIFVTLEPCQMCAHAIVLSRINRLVFGAYDPSGGGIEHGSRVFQQPGCNHKPELIGGIDEVESSNLLKKFFAQRRYRVSTL
ncbi:MAG: tRNA-specific adenosine deaminase [Rhodospirillaceae bacterium]|nr:tRNA-specific adenosine deaminase [Rhodospirillaceae bacterium]